ncbi:uncharacterized protein V6R79_017532 [Siganus canaliculatus]
MLERQLGALNHRIEGVEVNLSYINSSLVRLADTAARLLMQGTFASTPPDPQVAFETPNPGRTALLRLPQSFNQQCTRRKRKCEMFFMTDLFHD